MNFDNDNKIYREKMEYQNLINLLENTNNQLSHFITKNWFGVNDDMGGAYNANSLTKNASNL